MLAVAVLVRLLVVSAMMLLGVVTPAQAAASYEASQPQNIRVSAGNGQVTVSWDPPAYDGGWPILKYWVRSVNGVDDCETPWSSAATSCTVYGLENGVTYTFTVQAYNNIAYGVAGVSPPVSPCCSPPQAPTNVRGTSADASVVVIWDAPTKTGGAIGQYVVTASPGGATCATGTTSCRVSGLANGTAYTFTVSAQNSAGSSPASSPSGQVIPVGPPSPPQSVVARANGRGAVWVEWQAPASDGGAAVMAYAVVAQPGGATCQSASLACQVSGLVDGTAYTFTVVAANRSGSGPASPATGPVTTYGLPEAPTRVQAYLEKGSATVTWVEPTTVGGAPVSGYVVTSDPGGLTCTTTGRPSCTVRGLSNGNSYVFRVTAMTEAGVGPASEPSPTARLVAGPGRPEAVTARAGTRKATVNWKPPRSKGGLAISGYTVTASPGGRTCRTTRLSCTFTGLANGTAYTFTVQAINAKGRSLPAQSATVRTTSVAAPPPVAVVSPAPAPEPKPVQDLT